MPCDSDDDYGSGLYGSGDRRPIFYWQGHPVYAAPFIVALHVAAFLVAVVVTASDHWESFALRLGFISAAVRHGWLWQPFTYGLVHIPASAIWFALEMYFLWTFGREVERFLGRRSFLRLYLTLWFAVPVLLLVLSLLGPTSYAGSRLVHFSIFVAFATLYPGAMMFRSISAKWMAIILTAAYACMFIAGNDYLELILLMETVGLAYAYVRWERGFLTLPSFRMPSFRRRPKFRVLPKPAPASAVDSDIDVLLEKIARSGMASLTSAERARLERASTDLKKENG